MKRLLVTFVALSALGCLSTTATAAPAPQFGPSVLDHMSAVEQAQFIFSDRRYCFYWDGWHGPGWYWCGYAWRRGYGWGGGRGWHGWHEGARRGAVTHGPRRGGVSVSRGPRGGMAVQGPRGGRAVIRSGGGGKGAAHGGKQHH